MQELIDALKAAAKGNWAVLFVGAVLLVVLDMRFDQIEQRLDRQDQRLDRLELKMDRIEEKVYSNGAQILVLQERILHLHPDMPQAQAKVDLPDAEPLGALREHNQLTDRRNEP